MLKLVKLSVLPVAMFAVACGRDNSSERTSLTADLKRDLAAASASSVELASTARDYELTKVVSAIESPRVSEPVRRRNVRRPVAKPVAATAEETAKAPDPAPETKVEVAEAEPSTTEAPAPAIDTPTNVAVTPRPTPVGSAPAPVDAGRGGIGGGSGGGGLGGIGEAIGTVIGVVVIRGGAGGVDHCDPRTDRRRPPPNTGVSLPDLGRGADIIRRSPMPGRPTFPRR